MLIPRRTRSTRAPVRAYRLVAVGEGIAFPALLVAALLRSVLPDSLAVAVLGSVHGALFCLYLPLVLLVRRPLDWNRRTTLLALVAALLPGGTWWVERQWARQRGHRSTAVPDETPAGRTGGKVSAWRGD